MASQKQEQPPDKPKALTLPQCSEQGHIGGSNFFPANWTTRQVIPG